MHGKFNIFCLGLTVLLILAAADPALAKKKPVPAPAPEKTAYEKLFDGKKHKTAAGLVTLHKIEGEVYLEVPDSLLGRNLLLGMTVMSVSDGDESSEGMQPSAPKQVVFQRTDSLLQIAEVSANYVVGKNDANILRALEAGRQPSVIASFPIRAFNRDSSAVVVKATPLFINDSKLLSPKDSESYSSRDGFVTRTYKYKGDASCIRDIAAFGNNASVVSELSYEVSAYVFGVIALKEGEPFSATVRISFMRLPEKMEAVREADMRVGTATSRYIEYSGAKQGADIRYYASRWRICPDNPVVFYIDDKFPAAWKPYIERGVGMWNDAFARIGIQNAIEVRCASADSLPDVNDICYSAIRYIPSPARNIRHNVWTDPRTGEILSANIYISHNIVQQIQAERLLQTGAVDKRVRTLSLDERLFGESLTQKVAHYAGLCLGLLPNPGASQTVPVDSLRSARYTSAHGLSASVMDELPLNFVAQEADFKAGTKLCQTELGAYDHYAIGWLYGESPVQNDPVYRFLREQPEKFAFDPRAVGKDLGDDPIRAAEYAMKNLAVVMRHMPEWIDREDTDYAYRQSFPEYVSFYYNSLMKPIIARLGGVYLTERYADDEGVYCQAVSAADQRKAMEWLLRSLDDMTWLDNRALVVGEGLNPGISDFIRVETFDTILGSLERIALSAALSDDPYTRIDALNDLSSYLWKSPNTAAEVRKQVLQTRFTDRLIGLAEAANGDKSKLRPSYFPSSAAGEVTSAFAPITGISYLTWPEDRHLVYGVLLDCRKRIAAARAATTSGPMKDHYAILLHKIENFFNPKR